MFFACAKENLEDVKPETIRQEHTIRYNEEKDETTAETRLVIGEGGIATRANFNTEDPKVLAEITDNKQKLHRVESPFNDTYYTTTFKGKVVDHSVKYTDIDGPVKGKTYVNTAKMEFISMVVPFTPNPIHRKVPSHATWAGDPLQKGETITLHITQVDGKTTKYASIKTDKEKDTFVTITDKDLKDLTNGPCEVYWVRSKTTELTQATKRGGTITTESTSKTVKNVPIQD
jgi:hypothetical protein